MSETRGTLIGFPSTIEDVRAVPTPEKTKTWLPIPFGDLIDMTKERLEVHGFNVCTENYSLNKPKKEKNIKQMFGVLTIEPLGSDGETHPDWRQALGIRSSHNKTLPVAFCGGGHVMVCTNLDFVGDMITLRKHTPNAVDDLPMLLDEMLEKMGSVFVKQTAFVDALKEKSVTSAEAHDLMMKVARSGAFPVSKMLKVTDAWDIERGAIGGDGASHPRFGYTESGDTAWDLLNAFTFVNKERTAENQIDGSMDLTSVFEKELALQI